jgi:hypothetical protein
VEYKQGANQCCTELEQLIHEIEVGSVIQLHGYFVHNIQLKTKANQYQCVCVCYDGGEIQIGGVTVKTIEKALWQSEIQ